MKSRQGLSRSTTLDRALAGQFEAARPELLRVAYRMLGSLADAEDVVQAVWMPYQKAAASQTIGNTQAFLVRATTRRCIDLLRSRRRRIDKSPAAAADTWLPELLIDEQAASPEAAVAQRENLSVALLRMLEALGPVERAVFVLAESFDFTFGEIGEIVERSESHCRQIARRARARVAAHRQRFDVPEQAHRRILEAFLAACADGDVERLVRTLADDVVMVSDGGGQRPAASRPVCGKRAVSRLLAGLQRRYAQGGVVPELGLANGDPALFFREGERIMAVVVISIGGEGVSGIWSLLDPEKLSASTAFAGH